MQDIDAVHPAKLSARPMDLLCHLADRTGVQVHVSHLRSLGVNGTKRRPPANFTPAEAARLLAYCLVVGDGSPLRRDHALWLMGALEDGVASLDLRLRLGREYRDAHFERFRTGGHSFRQALDALVHLAVAFPFMFEEPSELLGLRIVVDLTTATAEIHLPIEDEMLTFSYRHPGYDWSGREHCRRVCELDGAFFAGLGRTFHMRR